VNIPSMTVGNLIQNLKSKITRHDSSPLGTRRGKRCSVAGRGNGNFLLTVLEFGCFGLLDLLVLFHHLLSEF